MKHISIAMNNLNLDQEVNAEHISLLENILRETRNPKIAAVLALDLMLVGVDTVSSWQLFHFLFFSFEFKAKRKISFPVLEISFFHMKFPHRMTLIFFFLWVHCGKFNRMRWIIRNKRFFWQVFAYWKFLYENLLYVAQPCDQNIFYYKS